MGLASGRRRALPRSSIFFKLCDIAREYGVSERTFVHCFMDGRDTDPRSGKGFIEQPRTASRLDGRPDRHDRRPLLRHGPRQALGTREGRLRCAGQGRRRGGDGHGRSRSEILRCGGHRRVHQARCARRCAGTACRSDSSERSGRFLQLPQRPRQGGDDRPHAGGYARRGDAHVAALLLLHDPLRRQVHGATHPLRQGERARHHRRVGLEAGAPPTAHRRDREVRPRDVLPQRRPRGEVRGRGAYPRGVAQGGHVRPPARDVGPRGGRQGWSPPSASGNSTSSA